MKKVKFRQGEERREDPDIDITFEDIRRRIRQEKKESEAIAQEQVITV